MRPNIVCCHRLRCFLTDGLNKEIEVREIVFGGAALGKAAMEIVREAYTGLVHGGLLLW
jgi:hypothetical protein